MAKLEQREIVHSNVIDSAWPKICDIPKLVISLRIRDSTGRFWALTSLGRSSIQSSHPILKGHRSASVVLVDTRVRYDSHSRTEDMLREFRFKWSGRDTGQVKVDCRSDFFFCGETLPKRSQAEALLTRVYWRPWPPEHVEAATKWYSRPLRNVPSFGQKPTCEDARDRGCAHWPPKLSCRAALHLSAGPWLQGKLPDRWLRPMCQDVRHRECAHGLPKLSWRAALHLSAGPWLWGNLPHWWLRPMC